MLREKIDTLKSKNYTITKITANAVIITIHLGTLNFQRELESNSNLLVEGTISISKGKDITRYF